MNITPLEIRQKTFEKGFRGYEKDEVTAFLQSLSGEWQKVIDENKELRMKIENLEKEVQKLREVESSLYKTLKTAEDTGATIKDQATKMAELHMKETEMNAEALMNDTLNKSRDTIEQAEMMAKQTIEEMEAQLKDLMHTYKNLENFRDDLISDIKTISTDALERVERMKAQVKKVDIEGQYMKARRETKKVLEERLSANSKMKNLKSEPAGNKPQDEVKKEVESEEPKQKAEEIAESQEMPSEETKKDSKSQGSFFDDVE